VTTEFMALAEAGEAELVYCECGWAANVEAATTKIPRNPSVTEPRPLEKMHTPDIRTIADLARFLSIPEHDTVKTMVGIVDEPHSPLDQRLVFFCIPGDRDLNDVKASWAAAGVRLLEDDEFKARNLPKGSLGPVEAKAKYNALVVADVSLTDEVAWGIGANEDDYHYVNAQPGRDFEVDEWADLVLAAPADFCPECGAELSGARGIEISQVFQLGTRYSESMGATYADENGDEQPFIMGCYGVGVSRSLAAVIEQHNDENGILWPVSVAPLEVAVLPLTVGDDEIWPVAERLWRELADVGVEVVLDDREERPGVKFNDADLIGWPYQVVVGKKGLAEGVVELKTRATGERTTVPLEDAVETVAAMVVEARADLSA
jgi:prolyl-tRNA synthetase